MGYRSDVAAVIYADDSDTVEVERQEHAREKYAVLKVLMNTRFKVDNIKWYEGYPEIDGFMKMLDSLEDMGYVYEYLRVGEEPDDIDRKGNGCNSVLDVTSPQIEWDE
jgi:hypothetical protein